jgi:hypothetical protein
MIRLGIAWILFLAAIGAAQEPSADEPIPIPIPIEDSAQTRSIAKQSFVDDVFDYNRNPFGFSLGVLQGYSNDVSTVIGDKVGSGIATFIPKVFFNAGRRKSRLHVDLGTGYRSYYRSSHLNSWDYYGNAQLSHQFSRKTSFEVSDQFTSSFNDSWSFVSLSSPLQYTPTLSNEVIFNRQRINRNSLLAELDSHLTRKTSVGIYGSFSAYQYPQETLRDSRAIQVGGNYDYQLTRRLYLTNSYSSYFNYYVNSSGIDYRIDRLQVLGLELHLTRAWRVWGRGGVDWAHHLGNSQVSESIDSGIGYTAEKTMFSVTYQRGATSAIGLRELMKSDIFSGEFGYRVVRWLSANAQSYYYRNSQTAGGLLETLSVGGGLQFELRRDLFASVNGFAQHQNTHNSALQGLDLDRYSAYVGIQYVWPALKRRH